MEYFNNVLCVSGPELIPAIIPINTYKSWQYRRKINVVRRACLSVPALIEYDSLPTEVKAAFTEKYGDIRETAKNKSFKDSVITDPAAIRFYSNYTFNGGLKLKPAKIAEYTINASVLNRINEIINNRIALRKALGGNTRDVWGILAEQVAAVKESLGHTLPENKTRLKAKLNDYKKDGYIALIHKGFCNNNSRKVSVQIERLILSLYSMPNRPFMSSVYDLYIQFIGGALEVADVETGEMFDRKDFCNEDGTPIVLSETTVKRYLTNPLNRVSVDSRRMGKLEFSSAHRPHHHRHRPFFSFSKISMDDRDLPRKTKNGQRVKAYYAYDLASGAVIGASYSYDKDLNLINECFRDMFRFIERNGWGMPLEVEVEHHLMNKIEKDLNDMFKFVRFCAPANSQEKGAEHMNRAKKYSVEKSNHIGIGRWWARSEAYRTRTEKVNDEFTEPTYDYSNIVADDKADIIEYNNALHPNQKLYKGMTRLDVLRACMNPQATNINRAVIMRVIGEHTTTSVRRSQYLRVQYNDYQLSHPAILGRLLPGNRRVDAYYLPDDNGEVKEVYIYQNDCYLDKCTLIDSYNEAKAEQTDEDRKEYTKQAKYVSTFDKMVKDFKPGRVGIISKEVKDMIIDMTVEVAPSIPQEPEANLSENWDSWEDYTDEDIQKIALQNL